MVYRIVRNLLNNEKTIQQLSESMPIKVAARAIVRGIKIAEGKVDKIDVGKKLDKFRELYREEYQKALKK